jgi:hypothetical protein
MFERGTEARRVPRGQKAGARMNKPIGRGEPPPLGARTNRERLALERPAILNEIDKKAADVRMNMARLRELRLAKEARDVRTEILTGNQPARPKPKKRFR